MKENEILRAEGDLIVGTRRTGKQAGPIILRIAVGIRAPLLEEFRECGLPTASLPISATILIGLEHRTWVVASAWGLQLARALSIYVCGARDTPAARDGAEFHGDVEAVHEGDVDVVEVVGLVQSELSEGVWG